MAKLEEYASITGKQVIDELYLLAEKLRGKSILNINSTAVGGGVAEILNRMMPLMKDLGVDVKWDVIRGDEKFFVITKKFHNALHGVDVAITDEEISYFLLVNQQNASELSLAGDIIFIHDPQPIALIEKKSELGNKWLWRCHIDFSKPIPSIWNFLRPYIERYDSAVFSAPAFARQLLTKQVLVSPSIDPLSDKNKDLPEDFVDKTLEKFGVDRSRPIVTQISRFDYLKDPLGVIRAFRLAKKYVDCQLILAGGGATDDPEGMNILNAVKNEAESDPDIFVLFLPPGSDLEINALQRGSTIVLQKSLKEGFGLTVAEALWKAKPVIASAVGGIPLQITHKFSGILTHSVEGTAYWIKQLIHEPEYTKKLGINGRAHVKDNFLITRHIQDYLLLFLSLFFEGDMVNL
jgi:trehalose synthase